VPDDGNSEGGEYVLLCSCGEHSRIELLALRIYETKPHPIKTYLGVSNSRNLLPIVVGRYVKPGPRTFGGRFSRYWKAPISGKSPAKIYQ
jgi:hypothetical protein